MGSILGPSNDNGDPAPNGEGGAVPTGTWREQLRDGHTPGAGQGSPYPPCHLLACPSLCWNHRRNPTGHLFVRLPGHRARWRRWAWVWRDPWQTPFVSPLPPAGWDAAGKSHFGDEPQFIEGDVSCTDLFGEWEPSRFSRSLGLCRVACGLWLWFSPFSWKVVLVNDLVLRCHATDYGNRGASWSDTRPVCWQV